MLKVLRTYAENRAAREEMQRRSISYWPSRAERTLLDRFLLRPEIVVGELNKSWDVIETVRALEAHVRRDAPILDLGAYASEVLCSLHLLGYSTLTGLDLNPAVRFMPFNQHIRYVVGDMVATPFAGGSMSAITAISAIEHGVLLPALFGEVSRLLTAGGLFLTSTDYWPEKIDTSGIRMYGTEWTIFSKAEIEALFDLAGRHGLVPLGDCHFDASEPAIDCAGKRYTFAWLALVKAGGR